MGLVANWAERRQAASGTGGPRRDDDADGDAIAQRPAGRNPCAGLHRTRAGADRRADAGGSGRGGDQDRAARRRGDAHAPGELGRSVGAVRRAQSRQAQPGHRPEGRGGPRRAAPAAYERRCAAGGLPSRRDGAARARARRLRSGQRAAGLRPDDRVGPGRPHGGARRARHQLHLPDRCAARDRP